MQKKDWRSVAVTAVMKFCIVLVSIVFNFFPVYHYMECYHVDFYIHQKASATIRQPVQKLDMHDECSSATISQCYRGQGKPVLNA